MSLTTRTEPAHCRQVATRLEFGPVLARSVDWAEMGKRATEQGTNVDVRWSDDGVIIEFWWPVAADDAMAAELDQADVKAACEKLGVRY